MLITASNIPVDQKFTLLQGILTAFERLHYHESFAVKFAEGDIRLYIATKTSYEVVGGGVPVVELTVPEAHHYDPEAFLKELQNYIAAEGVKVSLIGISNWEHQEEGPDGDEEFATIRTYIIP